MSVQEIKDRLAMLPRQEQDEVIAFLFHPRTMKEADNVDSVARRAQDKNLSHWWSPDEFEQRLDDPTGR